MNEALEFHDSTVRCVEQHGSSVFVEFEPGVIHRTGAGPGIDDGDVFLQPARLVFREASVTGNIAAGNGSLSDGTIYLPANALSLVPVPHDYSGDVRSELVFVNGEVLNIVGHGFNCSVHGDATFLQRFLA